MAGEHPAKAVLGLENDRVIADPFDDIDFPIIFVFEFPAQLNRCVISFPAVVNSPILWEGNQEAHFTPPVPFGNKTKN
jgi:hypothetical protein